MWTDRCGPKNAPPPHMRTAGASAIYARSNNPDAPARVAPPNVPAVRNGVRTLSDYELSRLEQEANALGARPVQGDGIDELAARWKRIRDVARILAVVERDYCNAVGDLLADREYSRKDGYPLADGTRIRHEQRTTEKWQGRRLLRAISTPMVDPSTGEVTEAVPLRVLADIIPGVGTDDQTSSKWKLTGLRNIDVDPDDYRTVEWKPPHAELGGRTR